METPSFVDDSSLLFFRSMSPICFVFVPMVFPHIIPMGLQAALSPPSGWWDVALRARRACHAAL